jgi:hypothetical protein
MQKALCSIPGTLEKNKSMKNTYFKQIIAQFLEDHYGIFKKE